MKAIIFLLLAIFVSSLIKNPLDDPTTIQNIFGKFCKECQYFFGPSFCKECPSELSCSNYCRNIRRCIVSDYTTSTKYCSCSQCP